LVAVALGEALFSEPLKPTLGGSILHVPYTITMEVAYYRSDLTAILPSDFRGCASGRTSGSVVWTSTPAPATMGHVDEMDRDVPPGACRVGQSFEFQAVMTQWRDRAYRPGRRRREIQDATPPSSRRPRMARATAWP